MSVIFNFKRISALVLLLAFFMPLSQCSGPQKENSSEPPEISIKYAYSHDSIISISMLASVAAFFWPSLIILLVAFIKALNFSLILKLTEIVFCCGTAYMLVALNIFGSPLYGSYVAMLSIAIYGLITLYESFLLIRTKKHNKSSNQTGAKDAPPG